MNAAEDDEEQAEADEIACWSSRRTLRSEPYTTVLASAGRRGDRRGDRRARRWLGGSMRLSEWRAASPSKEAGGAKVAATVDPVLRSLGAEHGSGLLGRVGRRTGRSLHDLRSDRGRPHHVLSSGSTSPARARGRAAKLIRWSRVQLGELAIETQGGHRILSFQVEQQVLQGADDKADRIARFAPASSSQRSTAGRSPRSRPRSAAPTAKPPRPAAAAKPKSAKATSGRPAAAPRAARGLTTRGRHAAPGVPPARRRRSTRSGERFATGSVASSPGS